MSSADLESIVPDGGVKSPASSVARSVRGELRGASGSASRLGRTRRAIAGWLLTREALVNLALVAIMVSVVWGSIALHLMEQQRGVAWRAERESSNLAQAAAESMGQTVASVDDSLRFMRAVLLADPEHFDITAWTNRVNETRGAALEFAFLGRDGRLAADSLGPIATSGDFSDQPFFHTHLVDPTDRLFISQPIAGHAPGRWSLLLTRRVVAADGWFMGVIAASIDPSWLTRLHRSLDIGRGMVMLVGTDGRIRAVALGADSANTMGIGQQIDLQRLIGTAPHAESGTTRWSDSLDGWREIVSFQRLSNADAYAVVGLNQREIMAPYRLYARQYLLFGGCITLLILIAGALLLTNTRRMLVSRQVLRDAVNAISQGIVMVDERGRVPVVNRRAGELLRLPSDGPDGTPRITPPTDDEADGSSACEERRDDGRILEVRTHRLDAGGFVRTYADITERKLAEAQITHMAMHDGLTDLPNRRLLAERLAEAVAKPGEAGAVLIVDLDRFKNINDRYGHAFGDQVLLQASARLRETAGSGEFIARLGGDEFCVLLLASTAARSCAAAVEQRAQEIVRILSEPYVIDGQEGLLSVSVGIARFPGDGASVDDLLTSADTALYRAKENGRATFRVYEPAMDVRIAERRLLEQDMRDALALGQFSLVYQPIFSAMEGEITGFEALLRWYHPTRGAISPAEFVPIAEASGIVVRLGFWVLETACAEAAKWDRPLSIAVNLSPRQFWGSDLADGVAATLAATGLAPERLVLEVTESVLIDQSQRTLATMEALRGQGVRIALDDFGTGYSSLSYLRVFPFDTIKIDRSFVMTVADDEQSRSILRAVLTLGCSLGLKVVAEGVETEAQLQWLRIEGCDLVQGFLLGRPMQPQQIAAFLADRDMAESRASVADAAG